MYDRVFQADLFKKIQPRFKQKWLENFVYPDGNVVVFLSSILGITVEGASASVFGCTATFCRSFLPDYAKQLVAIMRKETVKRDADGKVLGIEINVSDTFDPGNYRLLPDAIYGKAWFVLPIPRAKLKPGIDNLNQGLYWCERVRRRRAGRSSRERP